MIFPSRVEVEDVDRIELHRLPGLERAREGDLDRRRAVRQDDARGLIAVLGVGPQRGPEIGLEIFAPPRRRTRGDQLGVIREQCRDLVVALLVEPVEVGVQRGLHRAAVGHSRIPPIRQSGAA